MRKKVLWASALGALLTFGQLAICLGLAPGGGGLKASYLRLNQWDSFHYLDILNRGYHIPLQGVSSIVASDVHHDLANVGFFPGYPLIARQVDGWVVQPIARLMARLEPQSSAAGVEAKPGEVALLATSLFFCLVFWTEVLFLLLYWGNSLKGAMAGALMIACFPSAFFLVAGYSESLFLSALLGFILWQEVGWNSKKISTTRRAKEFPWGRTGLISGFWIGVSGFMLSATRLFGLPFLLYPFVNGWLVRKEFQGGQWSASSGPGCKSGRGNTLCLGAFSLAPVVGCGTFLLYCHSQFGTWDLYFRLQHLGWGNHPDYLALLKPASYWPKLFFEDTVLSIARASNLFIGFLFGVLARFEWRRKNWVQPQWLGLYLMAFLLFTLSLSGKANSNMDSMVRYNFPVFVLLVLGSFRRASERFEQASLSGEKGESAIDSHILYLGGFGVLLAIASQIYLIIVYLKGGWVA